MKRLFIIMLVLFGSMGILNAQDNTSSLEDIYFALETIDDLELRSVLSPEEALQQQIYYLSLAENIIGEPVTGLELEAYLFENTSDNWWRFISFVNIIWVFASIIIVLSLALLFVRYVLPLLKMIPIIVYEIILYLACVAFIVGGLYVSQDVAQFVALPGVLGLALTLTFSFGRRLNDKHGNIFKGTGLKYEHVKNTVLLENLILLLVWGITAIVYKSQLIGFLTIAVLVSTVTATRTIPAVLSSIGFGNKSLSRELLVMSFLLLFTYIVMEIADVVGIYQVFEVGVHWLGAYGYFAAVEWMASRWRRKQSQKIYIFWQIFATISGILAIFVGQFFDVPALTEVGGTFLLIYILSKYLEIPRWKQYWLWASLGLGILLYVIALTINEYPEFFLFS